MCVLIGFLAYTLYEFIIYPKNNGSQFNTSLLNILFSLAKTFAVTFQFLFSCSKKLPIFSIH